MSNPFASGTGARARQTTAETKAFYLTSEFIVYILAVIGVFIASLVVDVGDKDNLTGFDAKTAWLYVTLLSIGYMLSRGLAKSGSREYHGDRIDSTHPSTPPTGAPPVA